MVYHYIYYLSLVSNEWVGGYYMKNENVDDGDDDDGDNSMKS